jgi:hypothetical protein
VVEVLEEKIIKQGGVSRAHQGSGGEAEKDPDFDTSTCWSPLEDLIALSPVMWGEEGEEGGDNILRSTSTRMLKMTTSKKMMMISSLL